MPGPGLGLALTAEGPVGACAADGNGLDRVVVMAAQSMYFLIIFEQRPYNEWVVRHVNHPLNYYFKTQREIRTLLRGCGVSTVEIQWIDSLHC